MIPRIQPGLVEGTSSPRPLGNKQGNDAFATLLRQQMGPLPVKFSAHAQQRLESREVAFGAEELQAIASAVDEVAAKGGRESLVITDRASLVVNVPKRTVITVLSPNESGNTVVTNIDSAVVAQVRPAPENQDHSNNTWPAPERGGLGAAERPTRRHTLEV